MTATKTNEVRPGQDPGVRAKLSFVWISPYKVRQVLDLIRGKDVAEAESILRRCERDAADPIGKVLGSAVANASANNGLDPEELFVSACYADEGMTFKRFRYRARGRAGKIRKRTSHITVIVNRLPEDRLAQLRSRQASDLASRRRRVAGSRRRRGGEGSTALEDAAADAVERGSTPAPSAEEEIEPLDTATAPEGAATPEESITPDDTATDATQPADEPQQPAAEPAEPEETK